MGNGRITSAGGWTPAPSSPNEGSGMPEPMSETELDPSSPTTSPTPIIDNPHVPDIDPIDIPDPSTTNIGPGTGSGVPNPDTPDVGSGPSPGPGTPNMGNAAPTISVSPKVIEC